MLSNMHKVLNEWKQVTLSNQVQTLENQLMHNIQSLSNELPTMATEAPLQFLVDSMKAQNIWTDEFAKRVSSCDTAMQMTTKSIQKAANDLKQVECLVEFVKEEMHHAHHNTQGFEDFETDLENTILAPMLGLSRKSMAIKLMGATREVVSTPRVGFSGTGQDDNVSTIQRWAPSRLGGLSNEEIARRDALRDKRKADEQNQQASNNSTQPGPGLAQLTITGPSQGLAKLTQTR